VKNAEPNEKGYWGRAGKFSNTVFGYSKTIKIGGMISLFNSYVRDYMSV
jgi:hypothetical protein